VLRVIENIPKIITVMTKKDSSGRRGDNNGSAVLPKEVRMDGVMMSTVMKIMTRSIMNIEPPGGGGGGGEEPFAIETGSVGGA